MQGRLTPNSVLTGQPVAVLVFLLLLAVVIVSWSPTADAIEASGLYRVTLPVADRSQSVLNQAFQRALNQVLIKVSGSSRVVTQPSVQPALQNPSTYVQQFSYQKPPASQTSSAGNVPAATPVKAQGGLLLQVYFDPIAIDRLLTSNNLPLWGRERPLVIFWVGIDHGNGTRYILGSGSDAAHPNATKAVDRAAQSRGLPIFLPLMDLQDQNAVRFSDLNGGFMAPVIKASKRYEANAELAGVIQHMGGQWRGQWHLVFRGQTQQWETLGASQAKVLASAINGAADRLAASLAVTSAMVPGQALYVQVEGVNDISAYARIEHLLGHLTPIKSAQLVSSDAGRVVFRVVPRGQSEDVARNLGLVSWLRAKQSAAAPQSSASSAQTLYFSYGP